MEGHIFLVVDVNTTVADRITTIGWCNNQIAGGTPMWQLMFCFYFCGRWNYHLFGWCYCHYGRCYSHIYLLFTKGPGGFPYVLIITAKVPTLIPIDGITLVYHRVFVLGGDQEVLDGAATFEVSLDAIPTTDLFDTFTKTLCVGYDNMALTL